MAKSLAHDFSEAAADERDPAVQPPPGSEPEQGSGRNAQPFIPSMDQGKRRLGDAQSDGYGDVPFERRVEGAPKPA